VIYRANQVPYWRDILHNGVSDIFVLASFDAMMDHVTDTRIEGRQCEANFQRLMVSSFEV